jgi:hypothetical protein
MTDSPTTSGSRSRTSRSTVTLTWACARITLPSWTIRVVFPSHLPWLGEHYQEHARQELATPWPDLVNRLRWYFQQRRAASLEGVPIENLETYDEEHFCFRATRYQVLYKRWLSDGDSALDVVSSGATAEAIRCDAGRIECHVLPFAYHHLSPLVGSARAARKGAEEGDDGATPPRPPIASSNVAPDNSPDNVNAASA